MEQEQSIVEKFEKFTWKVENFSRLKTDEVFSETFFIGGYPWKIGLLPRGDDEDDSALSIYLEAVKTANMYEGWSRYVKFKLVVFNQLNTNQTITEEDEHDFNAKENNWGFSSLMELTELHDPERGFIVNDTCIVGAQVYVCNSSHEKKVTELVKSTVSLNQAIEVEVSRPEPEGTNVETLSPVSKVVCDESTKQADAELVSAALGRVIYFLKTRKVKDMNDRACKDLKVLWDELEKFRFDVTWLEPHVQYALGMKSYVEKALQLEKLKENMVALELETERLKLKFDAAEVNLDRERDLLKAKGYEERGLDSELGCGSWRL